MLIAQGNLHWTAPGCLTRTAAADKLAGGSTGPMGEDVRHR
jgi:hypothetical protein